MALWLLFSQHGDLFAMFSPYERKEGGGGSFSTFGFFFGTFFHVGAFLLRFSPCEGGRTFMVFVAYATGRNDTEVYRSYFIHSLNQVKLQYINTQSSMSDIIMNNTGIGIIKIRMIIFSLFYATIMQLTSIPAL